MIKLKVNKKTVLVPCADELTAGQYLEFIKTDMSIISYLSVVLGVEYKEAHNLNIKGFERFVQRIGQIKDYTKFKPKDFVFKDSTIKIKDLSISTVGQRFMIEESGKNYKDDELLLYILSVAINKGSMNSQVLLDTYNDLLNLPYKDVLTAGFFLARRFLIGKKNVMNYLKVLKLLMVMKLKESKRVLITWINTLIILKFKRFASS